MKITLSKNLFLFRFLLLTSLVIGGDRAVLALPPAVNIHIIYTGNLNGAFDDCACGGRVVGGFTRIITALDSLKKPYPGALILDSGDFLNSYSLPKANALMLKVLDNGGFHALNLGDQEFVESENFIFEVREKLALKLPFVSSNLYWNHSRKALAPALKKFSIEDKTVYIVGAVSPEAFDFIQVGKIKIAPVYQRLKNLQNRMGTENDLQILLFHGTWDEAQHLAGQLPWIDVIVLSHNQIRKTLRQGKTIIVETGTEGEYLGHLTIQRVSNEWHFENEFIPITRQIVKNQQALKILDEYFHWLRN